MYQLKRISITFFSIFSLVVFASGYTSAQARPPIPRASQKASVIQTVGVTDITVTYSRPAIKGRTVWGDAPADAKGEATLDDKRSQPAGTALVLNGHVWRTGANEATLFTVTDDVLINGQPLAAGKYSLHMIPGKEEWTVIFNKDDGQWGSFAYDATKDALRVKTKPQWVAESKEFMYFNIDGMTDNSATVNLRWEKIKVPFTVEVKDVVGATMTRLREYVANGKADDPAPAFNAANYAKTSKRTEDASKWYQMSLKASDEQVKAKPNFANYRLRTNILVAAGKMPEALAAAQRAVELGKAEKADTSALEKRIADMKAAPKN